VYKLQDINRCSNSNNNNNNNFNDEGNIQSIYKRQIEKEFVNVNFWCDE